MFKQGLGFHVSEVLGIDFEIV